MAARRAGLGTALVMVGLLAGVGGASDRRGWGYLTDRLVADGVPRERVTAVFADPRIEPFDGLEFSLVPRESRAPYRAFLGSGSIARARQCRYRYDGAYERAEQQYRVPASVVAAIIHVESGCGRNTGSYRILPQLARLAMANEPLNLRLNLQRHLQLNGGPSEQIRLLASERAAYLESTFYPEVRALFDIAERERVDPLAMRGSRSGAFGIPQFLPQSYLRYGADGNADERVSLYDPEDAIASCARYLMAYGWEPTSSLTEQRRVLWAYNRSTPYIDTVLALAKRLGDG